ncbi:MAG: protein kinase domain-containing protein [Anaerolineae bacterium]
MQQLIGNRYVVLREIGSGGMAWIYLAEDQTTGQRVALKVLFPQFAEDPSYVQRFIREAKLAGALASPHIVRVLDYGADRDTYYLAMEYIEGETVREHLDRRGPYPWREALHLLCQAAEALDHAHHRGIVHRDIKPQNLMVTPEGVLKVLDFGVARVRDLPSLTQSGFVGSPYYASPEQILGERVGPQADLYALGVVLYEMLTGLPPFRGEDPWSVLSQHIATPPPPLPPRAEGWPEGLEALIQRAMAKRPEDRFASAADLRRTALSLLEGTGLPAPPPAPEDQAALVERLYDEALQALEAGAWQRAVHLLSQVLTLAPHYRDAETRLAEAGRQVRLAALYQAARQAVAAQRWDEACDELEEIVRLDPHYLDAALLLPRARERAAAQAPRAEARPPEPVPEPPREARPPEVARETAAPIQPPPGPSEAAAQAQSPGPRRGLRAWPEGLRWAVAVVLLLLFAAATLFALRERGARQLALEYEQAVAHLEAGRPREALALLDQVLERDPAYRDAAQLREKAAQQVSLADLEVQAQAATLAGQWKEAIAAWTTLRARAPSYRPAQVAEGLCAAYGGLGKAEAAAFASNAEASRLEAALRAFRQAEQECPAGKAQEWAPTYGALLRYIGGREAAAKQDWDAAVDAWWRIYTERPGFADVAQRLYDALVARGQERAREGDLEGARQDFAAALELDVPDRSTARSALQALEAQPPPTPTHGPVQRPAPRLLAPEDGATFTSGKFTEIVLKWEPVPGLAPDEFYSVTVMRKVGGEPRYWGHALRGTEWKVSPLAGYGDADDDRFWWWVEVRKETGKDVDGKPTGPPISPKSETRSFIWR